MDISKSKLDETVRVLQNGGLVVFPSDTVYGLLVDAGNERAVANLIAFKERPRGKPISVFVTDLAMADELVEMNETDNTRLSQILPGPFTVVLKSKHVLSKLLESESGTLGIRIPKFHPVNKLIDLFGKPVTATSANRSGHGSVHSVSALMNQLNDEQKKMIDLVVDVGDLPRNKPSTVVDLTHDEVKVLRMGDLKFSSRKTYKSSSEEDTITIGTTIMNRILQDKVSQPVVLILEGDLGAGKTQLVKGVATGLDITERVVSPTFVVYYEYKPKKGLFKNFIHMDLYNIKDADEFRYLGMEKYLNEPNLFCIEWGEKAGEIIEILKEKTMLIYIHIRYLSETEREITVQYS